jgi:hypothetical protein
MENCRICLGPLPPVASTRPPEDVLRKTCRDRARYFAELERAPAFWRERGYPEREATSAGSSRVGSRSGVRRS